jgi:hypothetical protein
MRNISAEVFGVGLTEQSKRQLRSLCDSVPHERGEQGASHREEKIIVTAKSKGQRSGWIFAAEPKYRHDPGNLCLGLAEVRVLPAPPRSPVQTRYFPVSCKTPENWRSLSLDESLCAGQGESQRRSGDFVSDAEICVSRKRETRFAETRFE